jgi:SynChlorMet cassette protein ScmD
LFVYEQSWRDLLDGDAGGARRTAHTRRVATHPDGCYIERIHGRRFVASKDNPISNPVVVLREEFDDWAVLFNPDTAQAVGINPVGVAAWKIMDGTRSVEQIAAEIAALFSDVPGHAVDDIRAFVDNLTKDGFVGVEMPVRTP